MHGCMSKESAQSECPESLIEDSKPKFNIVRNKPLSLTSSTAKEIVQLQPQHVKLKNIRLGIRYN